MVTVVFPASGEQRTYAINNAPLSRLSLNVGETAQSHEGWELKIARVLEEERLLIYDGVRSDTGERMRLAETQLNNFTQIADAKSRLLSGQIDSNKWFNIRANTHNRVDQVQSIDGLRPPPPLGRLIDGLRPPPPLGRDIPPPPPPRPPPPPPPRPPRPCTSPAIYTTKHSIERIQIIFFT